MLICIVGSVIDCHLLCEIFFLAQDIKFSSEKKNVRNEKPTKLEVSEKEPKLNLHQELGSDSLDLLLNGYQKSPSTQSQPSASGETSCSQTKVTADDLDLNMTDKLFEDITKNLKNEPFIDALENYFKMN